MNLEFLNKDHSIEKKYWKSVLSNIENIFPQNIHYHLIFHFPTSPMNLQLQIKENVFSYQITLLAGLQDHFNRGQLSIKVFSSQSFFFFPF